MPPTPPPPTSSPLSSSSTDGSLPLSKPAELPGVFGMKALDIMEKVKVAHAGVKRSSKGEPKAGKKAGKKGGKKGVAKPEPVVAKNFSISLN